ncbi:AfsR/SARP family transcriptional regulator [Streptomyces sp. NPDC052036]|uniref:AfsR/SARP family transcriptional regulator n=1 Tax=unclassified Streptomyces TaxID=2593676 RepID=UPI00341E3781
MKFRILGPLEVEDANGTTVVPQAFKLRSLLALLCVNANSVVSTSHLIDALWSGEPPRTAETALQVYISKLRKHFKKFGGSPGLLATRPPGYCLQVNRGGLDLQCFDAMVAQARNAAAFGRMEGAAALLTEAKALWRGPALADVRSVPALDGYARRLEEKWYAAYERHVEIELALGRHSALISELYGLTAEHPTWENLHGWLIIALYRSGRISESLQAYSRVRISLAHELGVEPSARLQYLQRAVLARETWLDDPSRPILAERAS